jgi:hypothetical protein
VGKANSLNQSQREFILSQNMFFVATAASDGRVNLSPKGMDLLRVVDDNHIVWLNLTGSGNETAAHLADLNRMTLMFCAFEGDALILRVYGQARVIHPRDSDWQTACDTFPDVAGRRQIFDMTIDLVQSSCGTGVPIMNFVKSRAEEEMLPFYDKMGEEGVEKYWRRKNTVSIDDKPTHIFED